MNTWKPNTQNIMQQFQDFDNEGYDIKNCLFDIVQNSKMRFNQCKEVLLFGLKFTEAPSASNWTIRSIENYDALVLPKTFEELDQIPLDRPYNFVMLLDKTSIDKEIVRLGVEAHMFWELPKVREALNELCKKWGSLMIAKPTARISSSIAIVGSQKEKVQYMCRIGFCRKVD